MSLIVRFVKKDGFVKQRFLNLVHVRDIIASTLKQDICWFCLIIILTFKMFKGKDVIEQVTCMESGISYKL